MILKMSDADNMSCAIIDNINNSRSCQNSVDRESYSSTEERCFEIEEVAENERESSVFEDCGEVNLAPAMNMHLDMLKKYCRICSVSIDMTNDNTESDSTTPIELGCSCKNDLAIAHKHCAEHWFRIRGNKICEICGSIARNVASALEIELAERLLNDRDNDVSVTIPSLPVEENLNILEGIRFFTILLICLIGIIVFSWLWHIYTPS